MFAVLACRNWYSQPGILRWFSIMFWKMWCFSNGLLVKCDYAHHLLLHLHEKKGDKNKRHHDICSPCFLVEMSPFNMLMVIYEAWFWIRNAKRGFSGEKDSIPMSSYHTYLSHHLMMMGIKWKNRDLIINSLQVSLGQLCWQGLAFFLMISILECFKEFLTHVHFLFLCGDIL